MLPVSLPVNESIYTTSVNEAPIAAGAPELASSTVSVMALCKTASQVSAAVPATLSVHPSTVRTNSNPAARPARLSSASGLPWVGRGGVGRGGVDRARRLRLLQPRRFIIEELWAVSR